MEIKVYDLDPTLDLFLINYFDFWTFRSSSFTKTKIIPETYPEKNMTGVPHTVDRNDGSGVKLDTINPKSTIHLRCQVCVSTSYGPTDRDFLHDTF